MNLIDEWMKSKKKTYWKVWECNDTSYVEGSYCWVLFFTEETEGMNATYETGVSGSEEECKKEIKEAIGVRIKNLDLL